VNRALSRTPPHTSSARRGRHLSSNEAAAPLESPQAGGHRTLQTDEHLRTAAATHQPKQILVVGHREVGLGEPADLPLGERREQLLPVAVVHEAVVVRELKEGMLPEGQDAIDLGEHPPDRFLLVAWAEYDAACAELATVGAATARLHGEAIVPVHVQEPERGHGCLAQIEGAFERAVIRELDG